MAAGAPHSAGVPALATAATSTTQSAAAAIKRIPHPPRADAEGREYVLDGEIAVPDDRGVTHIGHLQDALDGRQPDRLAYFAFDLLYLDGHDLRRCAIEERKALLRRVLDRVRCPRLVFVDHVLGWGAQLFEHVRVIGAEGIVSKRVGSL
jgi:ATP-dependent DNA ligase